MGEPTPEELAAAQAVIARANRAENEANGVKLVDNTSSTELGFGHKAGEVKGPDPEQHPSRTITFGE